MGSFVSTPSGGGGGGGIPIIGGLLQLFGIGGGNQRQQFEDMARKILAGHDPWAGQPVATQSGLHQNIVNEFYRMEAPEGTPDFLKWPDPSTGLPTWIAIKLREASGQDPMSGGFSPSLIAAFKASGTSIPDSVRGTLGGWDPSILDRLDLTRLVTLISTTFGIPMGDIQNQVDVYNQQQAEQRGQPPERVDEQGRPVFTSTGTDVPPIEVPGQPTGRPPIPLPMPIPLPPGIFDPGGLPQPSPPSIPQLPVGQPPDYTDPSGMPVFVATGTAPLPSPGGMGQPEPIPFPPPLAPNPAELPLPPVTFPGFPAPPPGVAGPVPPGGTAPPGGTTPTIPGLPSGGPSLGGGGGMPAPYAPVVGGGNPLQSLFNGQVPQLPMVPNLSYFLRRS